MDNKDSEKLEAASEELEVNKNNHVKQSNKHLSLTSNLIKNVNKRLPNFSQSTNFWFWFCFDLNLMFELIERFFCLMDLLNGVVMGVCEFFFIFIGVYKLLPLLLSVASSKPNNNKFS